MDSKDELLKQVCVHLSSYASEKIRYACDKVFQEESDILSKIKQMKKISSNLSYHSDYSRDGYFSTRNQIFYQQAKFMVDVEDKYMHMVTPMYTYYWNYDSLEIPELRTYLTWRTKFRKGEYPKISTSYLFVYCSEIINLIGFQNPDEAFQTLKTLIDVYYKDITEPYYLTLFRKVVKDFIINYQLPISCQEYYQMFSLEDAYRLHQQREKVFLGQYDGVFSYLDQNSSYKVSKSSFYSSPYGFLVERAIPKVFSQLEMCFQKNGYDFKKIVFGEMRVYDNYPLFQEFPYVETRENGSREVLFSTLDTYFYKDKRWSAHLFVESPNNRPLLGIFLKKIESRIREKTKYKRTITVNYSLSGKVMNMRRSFLDFIEGGEINSVIEKAVDTFLIEAQQSIRKERQEQRMQSIVVEKEKFDEIRKATERIQEKLVTEDERREEIPVAISPPSSVQIGEIPEQESNTEMGMMALVQHFTEVEKRFIEGVLSGYSRKDLQQMASEQQELLEVFMENINIKALEFISDNLIEDLIDSIEIYEDYREELTQCLEEEKHGE